MTLDIKHKKNCKHCGAEFAAQYGQARYCSKSCHQKAVYSRRVPMTNEKRIFFNECCRMRAALKRSAKKCIHCGEVFECSHGRQRFCSQKCRDQRRVKLERANGVMPWDERKAFEKSMAIKSNCAVCGIEFRPRLTGTRKRAVTCSTNCRGISQRKYATIEEKRAAILAAKRAANDTPQKNAAREAMAADRAAKQAELDKLRSTCIHCSGLVEPELRGEYRFRPACQTCKVARAEASRKRVRRAGKAKRRAAVRGSDAERFDPFDIFDRDGWRCHLCGVKTIKAKRGTHHPLAPELDHIIPISKGGPHTRANTACSCRRCNHAKGAEIIGQPSLFATIAV